MTEEQILQKYENKLNQLYIRANTKSKKKKILYDLLNFSYISYNHFGIEKEYIWDNDEYLISLLEDLDTPFKNNILEYKEIYNSFSKSVINTFLNADFPFYDDYNKLLYSISDKELKEIMYNFLNSYDPKLQKLLKEKIENSEIFNIDLYKNLGYVGMCYQMNALKKSFIFCDNTASSIYTASTIIHEFGHAYEYGIMQEIDSYESTVEKSKTPYTEISSRFFEYAFLNYLKENRIYNYDTKMCLIKYYKELLEYNYNMHLICETEFLSFNNYGYIEINDTKISQYANKLKEQLNYYTLSADLGEEINFRHSFIYGLGGLFAIYLYENYKQDPNNFKKEFRNSLINYEFNNIDAFKNVGINNEEIMKSSTLKKVLKDI